MRLALLAGLLALALAPGARGATIEVQVSLRDAEASVAGLEVKVLGLTPSGDTVAREARSDRDGRARFAELPAPAAYLVMVEYRGIGFHAPGVRLLPEDDPGATRSVAIEVHEPTADASGVRLSAIRIFLEQEPGVYRVDQIVELENEGDRVVMLGPDAEPALRIALPAGHGELRTMTGHTPAGFELADGELQLRGPVHPGRREVVFSYELPSPDGVLATRLAFPEETPTLELYVADELLAIEAGPLHPARSSRDSDGVVYQRYLGFDLAAGSAIDLRIGPLPRPSSNRYPTALAAALLGAGLLYFVAQPLTRRSAPPDDAVEDAEATEKDALVAALRDLEHDFETGKLSAADRDRLREELRADALRALARLRLLKAPEREPEREIETACTGCGGAVDREARFCSHCGARL